MDVGVFNLNRVEPGNSSNSEEQIEAAYRYQDRVYRVQDVKNHVDDLKLNIDKDQLTEDDYLGIAECFIDHYDCDIDENTQWVGAVENYLDNFSE